MIQHASRLLATLGLVMAASSALAQVTINNLPNAAQPGRAPARLPQQPAPAHKVELPALPELQAPAGSEKVRFKLTSLTVEGTTVYTPDQLAFAYADLIGHDVSLADMYAVANKLTLKYRNDGYILSRVVVPAQDVTGGRVRLLAVEGFINRVDFNYEKNADRGSAKRLENAVAEAITSSKPLRAGDLERSLLLLNDAPGLNVRAIIKPSKVARAADMDIVLSYKPVDGYVQVDNRGTRFLGPVQTTAGVRLYDIAHDGGTLGLRGAVSSDLNELRFGEAGYSHAIGTSGLSANILGSTTGTHPGYTLNQFDVKGRANHLEGGLSYPLIRGRSHNLSVSGKFTADNNKTDALGTELFNDKIRALRLGLDWQKADTYKGINSASAQLSQGISGLGSSKAGSGSLSRAAAKPDFTKVNAQVSRDQHFSNSDWSLFGALSGQYADKPLFASEEFGLGGSSFLSAFDPNEVTGENGWAVRLEPRYSQFLAENRVLNSMQYYAFYDTGMVGNRDPLPGQNRHQYLSSAGVGFRAFAKYGFTGSFEFAKPLVGTVATQGNDDPRAFFRLTKVF